MNYKINLNCTVIVFLVSTCAYQNMWHGKNTQTITYDSNSLSHNDFASGGMSSSSGKFTVPTGAAGIFQVSFSFNFYGRNRNEIFIYKNGRSIGDNGLNSIHLESNIMVSTGKTIQMKLNDGDTISLYAKISDQTRNLVFCVSNTI